jgi:hypothetical protein
MKKRYDEKTDQCRNYASAQYYVRKGAATKEQLKAFGDVLPYIVKAQKSIDELRHTNYSMFQLFLEKMDKSNPMKIDPPPETLGDLYSKKKNTKIISPDSL